ncbi:MAG TPA: lipid A deacylase LpxR family protein [Bacteroidia bacterium]|jgi:lipid A 3-O-deacylase|nr:lipid A deacylase LpxR family protein [Bacteroidia bacterium]
MRTIYALLFILIFFGLKSQSDSIQKPLDKTNSYLSINYDNDFFSATDRYYTQGIYLEYIAPFWRKSPVSRILIPLNKRSQNYYGLAGRQDCFTPGSIRYDTLNYLDRPYAATMYLSQFLISIDNIKKRRLTTKIDLGVIGRCAVCEEEQKGIHRALVNIQPLGWQYQIATDYMVNYSFALEQGLVSTKYFELNALGDLRAGTIYDDASLGLMIRTGFMAGYFKQLTTIKNAAKNKFQLYAFAKGKTKFVGYNATMEGGLFSKSIHTLPPSSITPYVLQGTWGVVLAYKRFSVEYTKVYISPEFLNGRYHGWGHCNITICF